jgi:hypothetical protein
MGAVIDHDFREPHASYKTERPGGLEPKLAISQGAGKRRGRESERAKTI